MEKKLGGELELDIKLEDGMAKIVLVHEGELGGAKIEAYVSAVKLVDKVTDLIPGEWDDQLLDGLASKILSKKSN